MAEKKKEEEEEARKGGEEEREKRKEEEKSEQDMLYQQKTGVRPLWLASLEALCCPGLIQLDQAFSSGLHILRGTLSHWSESRVQNAGDLDAMLW